MPISNGKERSWSEKNPVVRGRNVEKRRYIHQGIYLMVQVDRIGSK